MEESHARFRFERMEDWQREAVLKKQREQAEMRAALEAQVREKKESEARRVQMEERKMHSGRAKDDEMAAMAHSSPAGMLGKGRFTFRGKRDSEPAGDSREEENTRGENAESMQDSFSRKFQWKQDEILLKQKKQQELRQSLAEQIREKEESHRSRQASPRDLDDVVGSARGSVFAGSPNQKQQTSFVEAGRRKMLGSTMQELPMEDLGEDFAKLFPWKQEAILKKRREQEETRRILQEQMNLRNAKKELERQELQREKAKEEAEMNNDWFSTLPEKKTQPTSQQVHSARWGARSPEKVAVSTQASEYTCSKDDEEEVCEVSRGNSRQQNHVNEELEFLKEQVAEQKRLLKEQSELMKDLQRQTEASRKDNRLVNQSEPESPKSHRSERKRSMKRTTGKGKTESMMNKNSFDGQKEKGKKVMGKTIGPRSNSSISSSQRLNPIRECTLKRNSVGKLCVEVEPVTEHYCVIKKVGKSFVKDDRMILRDGDLIVALGAFNAKRAINEIQSANVQVQDLETVLASCELPSFDQVRKALSKSGQLVTFAVFSTSKNEILTYLESHEPERVDDEHDNVNLREDTGQDYLEESEDRYRLQLRESKVPMSEDDESELDSVDASYSELNPSLDKALGSSSKLVYADEWSTLTFAS